MLRQQLRPQRHATLWPARAPRTTCRGLKRGMQQAHTAEPTSTTTHSLAPPTAADMEVLIAVPLEEAPPTQQLSRGSSGFAWMLVAAAVAAGFVLKRLKSNDPFAKDYMSSINNATDDLDPEIIAAARARRSRERANQRLDLDEVELPENHPWATRKPVTAEQEAAIQARLQVRPRRGPPGEARPRAARQLGGRE